MVCIGSIASLDRVQLTSGLTPSTELGPQNYTSVLTLGADIVSPTRQVRLVPGTN
jgi:hypothetical protein